MQDAAQAQNSTPPAVTRPGLTAEDLRGRITADPGYALEVGVRLLEYLRRAEGLGLCEAQRGGLAYEPTAMDDEQLVRKFVAAQLGGSTDGDA